MRSTTKAVILITLAFACSLPLSGAAPGSAADPLVTKSWVDQYVNAAYDELNTKLTSLAAQLPAATTLYFTVNKNVAVSDDGQTYSADVNVLLHQNRTILPVRLLADAIGAELKWDSDAKKATYIKGNDTIELYINKNRITVNGVTTAIDVGATLHNNRTYVPLRVIIENFGYRVQWDNDTKTAAVSIP